MSALWTRIGREPVLSAGVVRTLLIAFTSFGLGLSGEQVAAVSIAAEQIFSWYVRTSVTPEVIAVEREAVAKDIGRAEVTAEIAVLAAAEPQPVTVENVEPIEVVEAPAEPAKRAARARKRQ